MLTDQDTNERYSAVIAPNDARAMARAQINLLAMLGEWYAYADLPSPSLASTSGSDAFGNSASESGSGSRTTIGLAEQSMTVMPENPTVDQVEVITKRMYDQTAARRRLGMRGRAIVQKSFGGARYLREHEQMLWIGKAKKDMRCAPAGDRVLNTDHTPCAIGELQAGSRVIDGAGVAVAIASSSNDSSAIVNTEVRTASDAQRESLPSLGFGTSAEVTSLLTGSVSSMPVSVVTAQNAWIKRPQIAMVNNRRMRRDEVEVLDV